MHFLFFKHALVSVNPEDFARISDIPIFGQQRSPQISNLSSNIHPLSGIDFQRTLEAAAYRLGLSASGDKNYYAPAQRVEDFLLRRPSQGPGRVKPSYLPGVTWANLWDCLPEFIACSLAEALPVLGKRLPGYDHPDAVLTAVESRSSSPVRILRDSSTCQSAICGLYPCGEGAGYAGGIMSAAADGMRCAEEMIRSMRYT